MYCCVLTNSFIWTKFFNCGLWIADCGFFLIADCESHEIIIECNPQSAIKNSAIHMTPAAFKNRTKQFALRVIRLVDCLPTVRSADVIGKQLLRSATSVGANYRAACRARSNAEFRAKMGIVEECNESCYWLELMIESKQMPKEKLEGLLQETNEITAMVVASLKTSRQAKE